MRFVTFGAASARFCPAERAAVSAERPVLHELCLVDGNVAGCERMHVHGIGRAIQLAHEARLTLVGARDDGNAPLHRIEDVGGADIDATVTRGAA